MATYSSVLTWRIPWTEEPGGLQPIGLWSGKRLKLLSGGSTPFSGQMQSLQGTQLLEVTRV